MPIFENTSTPTSAAFIHPLEIGTWVNAPGYLYPSPLTDQAVHRVRAVLCLYGSGKAKYGVLSITVLNVSFLLGDSSNTACVALSGEVASVLLQGKMVSVSASAWATLAKQLHAAVSYLYPGEKHGAPLPPKAGAKWVTLHGKTLVPFSPAEVIEGSLLSPFSSQDIGGKAWLGYIDGLGIPLTVGHNTAVSQDMVTGYYSVSPDTYTATSTSTTTYDPAWVLPDKAAAHSIAYASGATLPDEGAPQSPLQKSGKSPKVKSKAMEGTISDNPSPPAGNKITFVGKALGKHSNLIIGKAGGFAPAVPAGASMQALAPFPSDKMKTAPTVPLMSATQLYQPVQGTSGGSRYFYAADLSTPKGPVRVAVRYQNNVVSIRIEGAKVPLETAMIASGVDLSFNGSYASIHLAGLGDPKDAAKAFGAVLFGLGLPVTRAVPDLSPMLKAA